MHPQTTSAPKMMTVTFGKEIEMEVLVTRDFNFNFHVLIGCVSRDLVEDEKGDVTDGIFQRW